MKSSFPTSFVALLGFSAAAIVVVVAASRSAPRGF
jgi:hypothetical protein